MQSHAMPPPSPQGASLNQATPPQQHGASLIRHGATHQPQLLSGEFVAGLSPYIRRRCRKLDRVSVRGSDRPLALYAYEPLFEQRRAYYDRFQEGVDCYLNGDWDWARDFLRWCVAQQQDDKPPQVLLDFMAKTNFEAPPGWPGFRPMG